MPTRRAGGVGAVGGGFSARASLHHVHAGSDCLVRCVQSVQFGVRLAGTQYGLRARWVAEHPHQ
ncbi:hypothetical protein, partial [Nocardia cyriacigeorgica]|uniref:hypothetical protein n=1 Tax=Nocardia cyriacigeorgica TaxID=135487 RepID=UPI0024589F01